MLGASAVPSIADYFHYEDNAKAGAYDGPHPFEETVLSGSAGVSLDCLGTHFSETIQLMLVDENRCKRS